ncbi:hypothetical protein CPB84DRAFT_1691185 [Gymnopilus junonius]|uniref:HNH nuclease domain-containing protein n=1 Tax=Gymnopilus junonius TaxID=109634 RepID=A0A9P5N8V0_GYMJU|nr:hypothetical protein CPB84DRAFT_1691185 [Gymnopilus junonius]
MAAPDIIVYVPLPSAVVQGQDLDIEQQNWQWAHCFTFPILCLTSYGSLPVKPFKWLRYAIGSAVGAQGHLSRTDNPLDVIDYNAAFPTNSLELYYHLADDERRRLFPADPKLLDPKARSNSTAVTTRRAGLRTEVIRRDQTCVMTGLPRDCCDTVHLIAHSKGDGYITMYTRRRSRSPNADDIVTDIDSCKNAILLSKSLHTEIGKTVGFLPVPNFAMDVADVHPSLAGGAGEKRYSAHLFQSDVALNRHVYSDVAHPIFKKLTVRDSTEWPPDILWDAVYASVILNLFGHKNFLDKVNEKWGTTFYEGEMPVHQGARNLQELNDSHNAAKKKADDAKQRDTRADMRNVATDAQFDIFDTILSLPFAFLDRAKLMARWGSDRGKAQDKEQRCIKEKVQGWRC